MKPSREEAEKLVGKRTALPQQRDLNLVAWCGVAVRLLKVAERLRCTDGE